MSPAQRCAARRIVFVLATTMPWASHAMKAHGGLAYLDGLEEWHIRIVRLERHHIL